MFRKFWLPLILKSVVLVEAITGLDGPSKKAKAGGLALGFATLLGEGFTDGDKKQVDDMIDGTVSVLNQEGIFENHKEVEEVEEEVEVEVEVETEVEAEEEEEETKSEPEPEHELVEWPLKGYSAEVYLSRWPNGQYAELARKLLNI